jgi:hypothetical protein
MKVPTFILFMFTASCGFINTSYDNESEWEKANRRVLEEYTSQKQAGKFNPSTTTYGLLDNCIRYTTYAYQRNLCSIMMQQTLTQANSTDDFADNLKKITLYFPRLSQAMKQVEQCMSRESPAAKIICAEWSKTLENFANGRTSTLEFDRQIATLNALLQASGRSGPTFGTSQTGLGRQVQSGASAWILWIRFLAVPSVGLDEKWEPNGAYENQAQCVQDAAYFTATFIERKDLSAQEKIRAAFTCFPSDFDPRK